jgi:hypothetical protein
MTAIPFLFATFFTYLIFIFFMTRLWIPHMGFHKDELPAHIPLGMQKEIERLRSHAENKEDFLVKSLELLTTRYSGAMLRTITQLDLLFKDIDWVWKHRGFVHCTQQNLMLRIFLVRSGYFSDDDIRLRHTFFWLDIHQYMQLKLNGQWVNVDPWATFRGKPIGEHAGI